MNIDAGVAVEAMEVADKSGVSRTDQESTEGAGVDVSENEPEKCAQQQSDQSINNNTVQVDSGGATSTTAEGEERRAEDGSKRLGDDGEHTTEVENGSAVEAESSNAAVEMDNADDDVPNSEPINDSGAATV